jgi:anti-sigma-K factor RskA
MTADVHALTGAYVLDTVSDTERMDFERHLRECETCAQEVYELRETAARLGRAASAMPPPRLKSAVLARISQVRQDPPQATVTQLPRRRTSLALRLTSAAAAVLLVAAGVLGVLLVQTRQTADESEANAAAMAAILEAGDAQVVNQANAEGGRMTLLASRSADRGLLLVENMPAPGPDEDFQVWAIGGGHAEPAGLLTDGGTRDLEVDGVDGADAIGITVEPAGGSATPSNEPFLMFELA